MRAICDSDPALPDFTCRSCNQPFVVTEEVLSRFPGWVPKQCIRCKKNSSGASGVGTGSSPRTPGSLGTRGGAGAKPRIARAATIGSATRELDLPVAEVLRRFQGGPKTGVFTDGAASPNPGPGGWGAVFVVDDVIQGEALGDEAHTTNNRMELLALRAGIELVPPQMPSAIYTDSQLCVNTFTKWAKGWKARGWRRKEGPIKNLELVQEIYDRLQSRPELTLTWIAAHSGNRWNEYADALATAYRRSVK
ncbi:MAG TPA: ribonuclease H [Polyangiaceae bacterium]